MAKAKWLTETTTYDHMALINELINTLIDADVVDSKCKEVKKIKAILIEVQERVAETNPGVVGLADQAINILADIKAEYTAESVALNKMEQVEEQVILQQAAEEPKKKRGRKKKEVIVEETTDEVEVDESTKEPVKKRRKRRKARAEAVTDL